MRIIVNAIPLLNIQTGIGRYLKELYTRIGRLYPKITIKFFDGTQLLDQMPIPPRNQGAWPHLVKLAWILPAFFPYTARIALHEKRSRIFFKLSNRFDIYHEPGFFPFMSRKHVKTVFTIHDLSVLTLPELHPKERVLFFNKYFQNSLEQTTSIITPSKFTKTEIQRLIPNLNKHINPIYLGYDEKHFYKRPISEITALRSKLGITGKYLLFVGTHDPRKNLNCILKAVQLLPFPVKLVCCGWSGWGKIKTMAFSKQVLFTEYVSDEALAVLYSGARALVYPSYYEGFGLPVLEAMACGCPVICSNRASLPEVTGEAGLSCNPDEPACFADAIQSVFTDDSLYSALSKISLNQALKFSWTTAVEQTLSHFYNDCV